MRGWLAAHWVDLVWLLMFGLASSIGCVAATERVGVTFDEPFYIKAGLDHWRTGSSRMLMKAGTMTLPVDAQTLPIHLWEKFAGQKYFSGADLPLVLPVARIANLSFWWLLLIYSMRLGRAFGGPWGGRLAVALVACDPNLLAHASLATTDIASVACVLVLTFHYWQGLGCDWKRRVLVPGLCYALAIQAKVSGLVFGMDVMVILGLWHLAGSGAFQLHRGDNWLKKVNRLWNDTYRLRCDLLSILAIALFLVFLYTGCDWQPESSFITWTDQLPDGPVKLVMSPLSHHLTIFSNAGEGLLNQIKHNFRGHDTFFLGRWYQHATMPYFPVALTMKTPLPVFVLLAAALLAHPRYLLSPVGVISLILLLLSPNYRVQIGIRFMFPMIVFGFIAMSAAIARGWTSETATRGVPRALVAGVLIALAGTAVWIWPRGLCYFNQAWGGPDAGASLLHESNYDWGQGLPELREWCRDRGEEQLPVWYYGMDPDIARSPFKEVKLHGIPKNTDPHQLIEYCGRQRYFAVSIGCFGLNEDITPPFRAWIEWFRTQTPIDRTTCFWIYRLE